MTIYITTVRGFAETLGTAKDRAYKLLHDTQDALAKASTYKDPNLSAEGVTAKRAELKSTFRGAAKNEHTKLASEVTHARQYLAEKAYEHTRLPKDTATLMQAQMRWQQVQMRLESGQDIRKVLQTADESTALAIAEYAPAWIAAHDSIPPSMGDLVHAQITDTPPTPEEGIAAIQRLIYARLAETAADPALRELLAAETAAETQAAIAEPWIAAGGNLIDGGHVDTINAAIASQMAASTAPGAPSDSDTDGADTNTQEA